MSSFCLQSCLRGRACRALGIRHETTGFFDRGPVGVVIIFPVWVVMFQNTLNPALHGLCVHTTQAGVSADFWHRIVS